jgi:hypothetical protein
MRDDVHEDQVRCIIMDSQKIQLTQQVGIWFLPFVASWGRLDERVMSIYNFRCSSAVFRRMA